jgi:hypothetical protein
LTWAGIVGAVLINWFRRAVVKAVPDTVSGRDPVLLGRYETTVDEATA